VPRRGGGPQLFERAACASKQQGLVISGANGLLLWRQSRTLSGSEFPLQQFLLTVAKASRLNDLESERERELAEARAIQVGMLTDHCERRVLRSAMNSSLFRRGAQRTGARRSAWETLPGIQIDSATALQ
jgi:hypothetical protein